MFYWVLMLMEILTRGSKFWKVTYAPNVNTFGRINALREKKTFHCPIEYRHSALHPMKKKIKASGVASRIWFM